MSDPPGILVTIDVRSVTKFDISAVKAHRSGKSENRVYLVNTDNEALAFVGTYDEIVEFASDLALNVIMHNIKEEVEQT